MKQTTIRSLILSAYLGLTLTLPVQAQVQTQANETSPNGESTPQITMLQLGENLYINPGRGGCTQCHGEAGNAPVMPLYPKIGGQSEIYLYNQLIDYREKRRKNGLFFPMEVAMEPFSDDEIKAMAHYLAAQTVF